MNKKIALFLPIIALLSVSCREGKTTSTSEQPIVTSQTQSITSSTSETTITSLSSEITSLTSATSTPTSQTPSTPSTAGDHITGISLSPSQAFVALKDSTKKITVSYSGSTAQTDPSEKEVSWSASPASNVQIVFRSNNHDVDVTFLKEGQVTITCTSKYNDQYTKSINVTVYENSQNVNLWNANFLDKDKDAAKFNDADGNGKAEGDVSLNGMSWHFKRYADPRTKVSGSQSLKFGNASDGAAYCPEKQFDLLLENSRNVSKIIVGSSSKAKVISVDPETHYEETESDGSSKLTIKVGEVTILDSKPTQKGTVCGKLEAIAPSDTSGNIQLSFSESVGYLYLQYIIIIYNN